MTYRKQKKRIILSSLAESCREELLCMHCIYSYAPFSSFPFLFFSLSVSISHSLPLTLTRLFR